MRLIFLLIILFFSKQIVFAQVEEHQVSYTTASKDTLRVDRSNQPIAKKAYDYKLDSSLFSVLRFENDSLVLYKLRLSYMFGNLVPETKTQLYQLLHSKNQVDTSRVMVIHYQDTLRAISYFPEKSKTVYAKDSMSHRHIANHQAFINQHKNCLKKNKRGRRNNVYHFFGYNEGHPAAFDKILWKKDHLGLVDQIYRDSYDRFNTIILHPDGTFVGYNYNDDTGKIYQDLIKGKRWELYKADFEKRVKALDAM
ncbi:hypothetical protein ESY86_03805 [Subsaximicrobium wynnwilliamsii]|uniref:Uncharacterized protein n=1 Tax=Subsaximicrobium wynnwilliamsii TaxID=291179 RepID=A0A5C6ZPB5_9FLAO|nr:hypothetical protein [Subsaximicrobium wynnwilliamsii]TXD84829.1 hypothetical protein ESY87_03585 [Subsaximicrobium wynnwilliamsii]TXD90500.1 hypothetical protein ESY86_03805 [Subsaximicrobium wynnwilliamsii]TXE04975.1 hypothetical protein ESY88_02110 [Subsaximicrobium wynnwilliamsii]